MGVWLLHLNRVGERDFLLWELVQIAVGEHVDRVDCLSAQEGNHRGRLVGPFLAETVFIEIGDHIKLLNS